MRRLPWFGLLCSGTGLVEAEPALLVDVGLRIDFERAAL